MNELTYGINIYVEDTEKTYHTLTDWGFALGNNNYISDPQMETRYVDVPYRDSYIDLSTTLSGSPVYKKRQLSFVLGGIRERLQWDSVVSKIRNSINGRTCHLTLDNDPNYYWRGRVYVKDFDRNRKLGTFKLDVPEAEPYKYSITASNEPWLWDPFNFETDMITEIGQITVSGSKTVKIPAGYMRTSPTFVCSNITSSPFKVSDGTTEVTLIAGSNRDPRIQVNGDTDTTLTFTGSGKVYIVYRGGSL